MMTDAVSKSVQNLNNFPASYQTFQRCFPGFVLALVMTNKTSSDMDFTSLSTRSSPDGLFDPLYNTMKNSMTTSDRSACPTFNVSAVIGLGKSSYVL